MKRLVSPCGFIAVILLILTAFAPAQAGLTVSGGLLMANVTPGQHISHVINVSTEKTDPSMDIQVNVNGFGQKLDGANDDLPTKLDVSPYSARPFLNVTPNKFSLEPGGTQKIFLNVDVPQDIGNGGKYALVNIYSPPIIIGILSVVIAVDVPSTAFWNRTGLPATIGIAMHTTSTRNNRRFITQTSGAAHLHMIRLSSFSWRVSF